MISESREIITREEINRQTPPELVSALAETMADIGATIKGVVRINDETSIKAQADPKLKLLLIPGKGWTMVVSVEGMCLLSYELEH